MKKKKLIGSASVFIVITVELEDAIHTWGSVKGPELRQCEKENEWNWKNRGETVVEVGVEWVDCSKVASCSVLLLLDHRTYITPS